MKFKEIRNIGSYIIGAGLTASVLLMSTEMAYAAKKDKDNYEFTTNTIKFMQERPTSQKEHPFSTQELQADGERYAVIPIPKDKDIKVNNVIINPNLALDFYLVPFSKSMDIINPSTRSVEIQGKNYIPINIGMAGNKLCIAKTLEERTINTDIEVKMPKIGPGFKITTRENKNNFYGIDGANLTGKRLLIIANDQYIYTSDDPNNFKTIDRLNFVFTCYDSSKIIINRETGNMQVRAAPFVPLEATFVDKEEPKKEEPKAMIE